MATQPFEDSKGSDALNRPLTTREWAMALAVMAVMLDGFALLTGLAGGARGWLDPLPFIALNGVVAPLCGGASAYFALRSLSARGRRDVVAWLTLLLAAGAATGAVEFAVTILSVV